jgi:hypothetical protein
MKGKIMQKKNKRILLLNVILILAFLPLAGFSQAPFLKGKVYYLDKENISLAKKMDLAKQEFLKTGKGEVYITGYTYLSRHEIHHGSDCDETTLFRITVRDERIRIKEGRIRNLNHGDSFSSEEGSETVGIALLHKVSGRETSIVDAELLDLDNTYDFPDTPLYWMGDVKNQESLDFLENEFESGKLKLQPTLVFVISSHDHPKTYDFLHTVALGKYHRKVRENAIFWLGNFKDEKSFKNLKEIYSKESDTKLKEQIIFAYQMNGRPEAIKELIRIAKSEDNVKVKKSAVFWIGQKASEECIKALKDVVEDQEKNTEVKDAAVFAISQLPEEKSIPMLINIARKNKNPSVKKKAMFWLGQTGDERAIKFFEDILLKE